MSGNNKKQNFDKKNFYNDVFTESEDVLLHQNDEGKKNDMENINSDLQTQKNDNSSFKVLIKKTIEVFKRVWDKIKKCSINAYKNTLEFFKKLPENTKKFWLKAKESFCKFSISFKKYLIKMFNNVKQFSKKIVPFIKLVVVKLKKFSIKAYKRTQRFFKQDVVRVYKASVKALRIAWVRFVDYAKKNPLNVELAVFLIVMLNVGKLPILRFVSVEYNQNLNSSYGLFDIALWIFKGQVQSLTQVLISCFACLYVLILIAILVFLILMICKVILKNKFIINMASKLLLFFNMLLFIGGFTAWKSNANTVDLAALGYDTIAFNFSNLAIYTYAYFIATFVLCWAAMLYLFSQKEDK